jgi:hypothetical protein
MRVIGHSLQPDDLDESALQRAFLLWTKATTLYDTQSFSVAFNTCDDDIIPCEYR